MQTTLLSAATCRWNPIRQFSRFRSRNCESLWRVCRKKNVSFFWTFAGNFMRNLDSPLRNKLLGDDFFGNFGWITDASPSCLHLLPADAAPWFKPSSDGQPRTRFSPRFRYRTPYSRFTRSKIILTFPRTTASSWQCFCLPPWIQARSISLDFFSVVGRKSRVDELTEGLPGCGVLAPRPKKPLLIIRVLVLVLVSKSTSVHFPLNIRSFFPRSKASCVSKIGFSPLDFYRFIWIEFYSKNRPKRLT